MQTPSEEDIERACTAFQKRLFKLIQNYSSRNHHLDQENLIQARNEAQRCVNHANHVLRTLTSKLRSLEHAMVAFGEVSSTDYITAFTSFFHTTNTSIGGSSSNNNNKHSQESILYEWFTHYLRIRDGFVLFESGECRHTHDVDQGQARSRGFQSRLHTKPKQSDGYTQTYSSKMGYSGYGLDEFNDEVVGIRVRLLDQLIILKGVSSSSSSLRENIWNKILENDMVEIWNMYFDQICAISGSLRDDFTRIQSRFVSEINQRIHTHWRKERGSSTIGKLKLVSDDKKERISFDSMDVCRDGDRFTLMDRGGSLPIGMSVVDWKKKFRPKQVLQEQQKMQKPSFQSRQGQQSDKKRRRIIEESSSDDDDDSSDEMSSKKKRSHRSNSTTINNGLVIRERQEVTISSGAEVSRKTSSLDEIKRQAGISATQLEQGYDQLEGEEFKSTMAANEDDLKEGFLADFGNLSTTTSSSKSKCPKLVSALKQLQLLRRNNEYQNHYFRNHVVENLWADFLELATEQWKEAIEVLLKVREDISTGMLKKTSDEAYDARENCREVNMLLGIHCLDMNEFISEEISRSNVSKNGGYSMSLPFQVLFSETGYCFLQAAEEASKTALILVMEQEDCQKRLPDSIANRFVKGQQFLLRGRAQHNIGQAFLEQSQCKFLNQGGSRQLKQRLLKQASREFVDALNSAKLSRDSANALHGHAEAELIDKDTDCTWSSGAMRQSFEALQLVSLTSRSHGTCLWELGKKEEAENAFHRTADLSVYTKFFADEHISSEEVIDAIICGPYWCAMTLAECATRSLEEMPIRSGNEKKGNGILRVVKLALQQARLLSDKICALKIEHSVEKTSNDISTRAEIDVEEQSICDMWEKKKAESAQKKTSLPISSLPNAASTSFPRGDIGGLAHSTATDAPRKIFVRDGSSSASHRSHARRKGRRNEDERQTASENFNDAFRGGDNLSNFDDGHRAAAVSLDQMQQTPQHKHIQWGDELLEEHQRNAYPSCCPPLPPNIPLNVKLAITAKLGDVLPKDDTLVPKLYQ